MKHLFFIILLLTPFVFIYPQPPSFVKNEPLSLNINEDNSAYVFYAGGRKYLIAEAVISEASPGSRKGNNSEILYRHKYVYEYFDGGAKVKMTLYTMYTGSDETWQKDKKILCQYNPLGKITSYSSYSANAKYGAVQTENASYTYDASGRLKMKNYIYSKTMKDFTHKFEKAAYYEYDAEGRLSKIQSNKRDGDKPVEKEDEIALTYADSFVLDSISLFSWKEGGWGSAYQTSYVKNDKGQPLVKENYYINGNIKTLQDSIVYSYDDAERPASEERTGKNSGRQTSVYSYNPAGLLFKEERTSGKGNDIDSRGETLVTFGPDGRPLNKTFSSWDKEISGFAPWGAVEYTYDNAGNCFKAIGLRYFNGEWVPAEARVFITFPGFKGSHHCQSIEAKYKPME